MADIIARFKGDTSDLDGKIGKASKTLMQMKADCEKVGGAFINLEKEELDFIKSLGKMETGSKTAKGTVAELTKAFTDMSAVYNRLTEEEKKDEGGKALRASLDQLKVRIKEGKAELKSISGEISGNGNLLEQLSGKFGVNIASLTSWGAAIGAGKVALDTMKDAFFASEANLDDWNRAVYAGQSTWEAFLTSINTGDISGFLGKIDEIVNAAKEAYNELDRLSTQKAINNSAVKAQEAENERFRAMLRTGRYIAPNDGRRATMKEGQVLTEAQKKKIAQQLENGMAKLNSYVRSEIEQTTKAIDALYTQQAKALGMTASEFRAGTANIGAFDERMAGYANYKQWEKDKKQADPFLHQFHYNYEEAQRHGVSRDQWDKMYAIHRQRSNPYQQYKAWGVFKDDGKLYQQINDLINQRTALQSQNYSNTANAYRAINRATGGVSSGGTGGRGGGATTAQPKAIELPAEGSIAYYQKLAQDAQKQINEAATDGARDAALAIYNEYSRKIKQLKEDADARASVANNTAGMAINTADTDFSSALTKAPKLDIKGLKDLKTTGQQTAEAWTQAANAIGSIGSALAGIEDPAVKVMGTIAQAIASVALAGAQAMAAKDTTASGWAWIGAAASITATMISTIAAIKSATAGSFANGGVIGGNSYYGDKLYARVNSGETVLNQRQARTALDMMDSGGGVRLDSSNLRLSAVVDGERLRFVLNANGKRTGRGEIAYTK